MRRTSWGLRAISLGYCVALGGCQAVDPAKPVEPSGTTESVSDDTARPPDSETDSATPSDSGVEPEPEPEHHPGGGELVRIAAGSFDMGCTAGQADCGPEESPVMPVTLTRDYWLGATEVTRVEYASVMGSDPSEEQDCAGDTCPVLRVTWHEAAAYTNALSLREGLSECYRCSGSGDALVCETATSPYDCDGYRLPTEAEWEGAARCGEDLRYVGSDAVDAVAWTEDNSGGTSHPVGQKAPNLCGLYDMSGNVWEWTGDWYSRTAYTEASQTDPMGPETGTARADRGGSWASAVRNARVSSREGATMDYRYNNMGLRVARTAP